MGPRARRPGLHRVVFLAAAVLLAAAIARDRLDQWVAATDLPPLVIDTSVEVRDRDGALLRAFTVADGRWRLDPGPVDPLFLKMLVGFEDGRFYSHSGIDPMAIARAGLQALWNGRVVSGGSTLTMQVARLLEDSGTGRWQGKLRQMRLALALERRLTKAEILDLYLRIAPYGGNLEGVRAASLAYFGKEPRHLTPAEAALLVAIPQSPEARRPDRFPGAAAEARARVLARMEGQGVLTAERVAAAETEPVPTARRPFPDHAALLAEALRRADPVKRLHLTTLDGDLQASLEKLAAPAAAGAGERLSVAILVADHRTGEILASVGTADWGDERRQGFVDMTEALRSPGSTLKPFVYALAFDQGLAHPETLIDDRPVAFGTYAPQNFDRAFRGTLTVREALQASLNIPVVSLTDAIGPANLLAALRRAGARPQIPGGQPGLAVALGGLGISLKDLVQSYAALARLGQPIQLSAEPGGATELPQRLFAPEAAWLVDDILAGLPPPPGAAPGRLAYKTGTSYGHRDALAIGFDGGHVAGVWMGRADGTPVPGAFGGELAAPLLFEVFGRLKPRFDPLPPPPPATLILPNARLPQPLRTFRPRGAAFAEAAPDAPKVAFPPDGATLDAPDGAVTVKVRDGSAPFLWLVNGTPAALGQTGRESLLALGGPGFYRLSVIDAEGRSAAVAVTVN
ncbi:penicillin-binding protein 1C [Frigidibacter sp. RF13]|uniref:penicillin-binding protein 1C n=1 Tax=Frigidibacter sp. RF13 TaxID=2997340 RepID=UPI00226EE2FE|nr:penicillin-binding protein 1C [Frigidibacter sp. RF13]MCY1127835.1 penicillin-binding protein 1C [Frigidibacter sp. RF13]